MKTKQKRQKDMSSTDRGSVENMLYISLLLKNYWQRNLGKTLFNVEQITAMQNLNLHQGRDHLSLFVGKLAH